MPLRQTWVQHRINQLERRIRSLEGQQALSIVDIHTLIDLRTELQQLNYLSEVTTRELSVTPTRRLGETVSNAYFDESSPYQLADLRRSAGLLDEVDNSNNGVAFQPIDYQNEFTRAMPEDPPYYTLRQIARQRLQVEERLFSEGSHEDSQEDTTLLSRYLRPTPWVSLRVNPDMPIHGEQNFSLVRVCFKHHTPIEPGKDFTYKLTLSTK